MTILLLCYSLNIWIQSSYSQSFCSQPNLSPSAAITCEQSVRWDNNARKVDTPDLDTAHLPGYAGAAPVPLGAAAGTAYDRLQCLDLQCLCPFVEGTWNGAACRMKNGQIFGRVVRKEYRTLTPDERFLYTRAFYAIYSYYRNQSIIHSNVQLSPGAHSGPNFLPWHREFLKRFEITMRTARIRNPSNPNDEYPFANVAIPYWDSSMDYDLQLTGAGSPVDSSMFSSSMMGSVVNGFVNDGQFGGFIGGLGRQVSRARGQVQRPVLLNRNDIDASIRLDTVNQMMAAIAGSQQQCGFILERNVELTHGNTHVWIGGDMRLISTSTNDPIFFLHHSFIDFIYESWRINRLSRNDRATRWPTMPTSCYAPAHRVGAPMTPFLGWTNRDGLSNAYTDNLYTYAPRSVCSRTQPCSDSTYLWCNIATGRCVAKLNPGALCRIINGQNPCSGSSSCLRGRCTTSFVSQAGPQGGAPPQQMLLASPVTDELCYNLHECCSPWSSAGDCRSNPAAMKLACRASCGVCQPTTYKLVDQCDNRFSKCDLYMMQGKCRDNQHWMAENCRKTCGLCKSSRAAGCTVSSTPKPPSPCSHSKTTKTPASASCLNSHPCCPYWSRTGKCNSDSIIMSRVCCAACKPRGNIIACSNQLPSCESLKKSGHCQYDFLKANCRKTCGTCWSQTTETQQCGDQSQAQSYLRRMM